MTEDEEGPCDKLPGEITAEEQKARHRQDSDCCLTFKIPDSKQCVIVVLQALKCNDEYVTFCMLVNEGSGL